MFWVATVGSVKRGLFATSPLNATKSYTLDLEGLYEISLIVNGGLFCSVVPSVGGSVWWDPELQPWDASHPHCSARECRPGACFTWWSAGKAFLLLVNLDFRNFVKSANTFSELYIVAYSNCIPNVRNLLSNIEIVQSKKSEVFQKAFWGLFNRN